MRVYYAHCMAIYNTMQEARDLDLLADLKYRVVNPNTKEIEHRCDTIRREFSRNTTDNPVPGKPGLYYTDAGSKVMNEIFHPLVIGCDVLAFRALPGGAIPAGVAREIEWAKEANLLVFELPEGILRRTISVELTREYLCEVGQR